MSARRSDQPRRRRPQSRAHDSGNLWRAVPDPDPQEPITPVTDPSALIDSLGEPPLGARSTVAQHYFAAVVERAAAVATALAASAGVLAERDAEGDSDTD